MDMCEERVKANLFMVKKEKVETMFPGPSCSQMIYFVTEKKACWSAIWLKFVHGCTIE